MTHSALSRRSFGISSGTLRISTITLPAFLMRLFSSFWADAGRPTKRITTINEKIPFTDVLLLLRFWVFYAVISGDVRHTPTRQRISCQWASVMVLDNPIHLRAGNGFF